MNGISIFVEGAFIGPRYLTDEPSTDGDRLREPYNSYDLEVLDTWKSSIRILPPDKWNGTAKCEQDISPIIISYDLGFCIQVR